MAVRQVQVGNVVRWLRGAQGKNLGVVTGTEGNRATIRLDVGEEFTFALPTDVLDAVAFEPGSQVTVTSDGSTGMVTGSFDGPDGMRFFRIAYADGTQKVAPEPSLRPARIVNPITLAKAGEFGSAFLMNLRIAATRLSFVHQFDELSSLSNSRVQIKDHQVGVLHRVASTYPHRFLLADEVGLGKTIEAGLVIKELKARGVANRVLILAPSGIVSQWQYELKGKFNEVFSHYNRLSTTYLQNSHPNENVWSIHDNVIASSAFAALDERRRNEIVLAGWDLVIIDEAHHVRRTWEGPNRSTETNLYRLAAALADPDRTSSAGMLLLTATPMQLHRFELYSLVELLDPTLFPDFPDFESHADALAGLNSLVDTVQRWPGLDGSSRKEAAREAAGWLEHAVDPAGLDDPATRQVTVEELLAKHRLSEVLIRNRKSVVGGFLERRAQVWPVTPTNQEIEAYEAVTEYVRTGFQRSKATRNNALGFLMATFQKMNASSSYTLGKSLLRRIERLEAGLPGKATPVPEDEVIEEQDTTDALGDLLGLQQQMSTLEEIKELRELIGLLDEIQVDSKAQVLREGLNRLRDGESAIKVVIFTQFRDTQSYVRDHLGESWRVGLFHGTLSPEEKDAVIAAFRDEPGPQILLATEAGGEGRNLQFAHTLINYDLPWNPMKIEQRIGRLDRIGQNFPVTIINFAVEGTIEERVLDVLVRRIKVFEDTVGGLDPILGDVETDLRGLFLSDRPIDVEIAAYEADLETRVFRARAAEERLADLIMDTKSLRKDEVRRILERKSALDFRMLQRFIVKSLKRLGSSVDADDSVNGVHVIKLRGRFLQEYPKIAEQGVVRRATFDPAVALDHEDVEFLAFGHPLVDELVGHAQHRDFGGLTGVRSIVSNEVDPGDGWFFTFALEFDGVVRSKELLPVYISADGTPDMERARWLLEQSSTLFHEDVDGSAAGISLPPRIADLAEGLAARRLMDRRAEMEELNRERQRSERAKLERYFEYRERAAREKLASVQRTFDRLSASDDPDVLRIMPVWVKNLENARRVTDAIGDERTRRLGDVLGRETLGAQHAVVSVSWTSVRSYEGKT